MPLPAPEDVRADFSAAIEALRKAEQPLLESEQRQLAERLVPAYNYVSAHVRKPSGVNALWAQSAGRAELNKMMLEGRKALEQHKAFVEASFESAEKHFKTVQLAGYAVFFATWGFTRAWIPPAPEAVVALLMIFSASVFVAWEIFKLTILAAILKRHAGISSKGLDDFIAGRSAHFGSKSRAIAFFSRARVGVWWLCVAPASCALAILTLSVIRHLLDTMIK